MQRFILSDLHIGHAASQYLAMAQALAYIRQHARTGDTILGLGDWWHMSELGEAYCLRHPMTAQILDLSRAIPTRLVPGNHDRRLKKYLDNPDLVNPFQPIEIIRPFLGDGIWYSHGDEYDPVARYAGWLFSLQGRLTSRLTPSYLKRSPPNLLYLMAVAYIHSRAKEDLPQKAGLVGLRYRGVVLGHTHMPGLQQAIGLPWVLDAGDMLHNATFVVQEEREFNLLQWDQPASEWRIALAFLG